MKLALYLTAFLPISICLGATSAWGQEQPSAVACEELATLTTSIQELVSVMRESAVQDAKRQELELAIAYLELRSRRIEALEQNLGRAEERKASSEDYLARIQQELTLFEEQSPNNLSEEEAERARKAVDNVQLTVITEEGKLDRIEREIIDLQNEIADGKRQLMAFEDYVLENLDLGD